MLASTKVLRIVAMRLMARETWLDYFTDHPDGRGMPRTETVFLQRHAPCLATAFMTGTGEQRAFLFMGAPGSGKTRLQTFFDRARGASGYLLVNPDEYKQRLPEYAAGVGAGLVHEESSWLAQQSRAVAIARGCALMNDAVGANAGKYAALVRRLQLNGYGVELACIHLLEIDALLARVVARAKRTGRIVPEHVVREAHTQIPSSFNTLSRLVDAAFLFNGSTQALAWERVSGVVTVHDQTFVDKLGQVLPP